MSSNKGSSNGSEDDYEPTTEEVVEYARWLGIQPEEDSSLLWIAREGLTAALPPNWKPCRDDNGEIYYFNYKTGQSEWDHPCDEIFRQKVKEERQKLLKQRNQSALSQKDASAAVGKNLPSLSKESAQLGSSTLVPERRDSNLSSTSSAAGSGGLGGLKSTSGLFGSEGNIESNLSDEEIEELQGQLAELQVQLYAEKDKNKEYQKQLLALEERLDRANEEARACAPGGGSADKTTQLMLHDAKEKVTELESKLETNQAVVDATKRRLWKTQEEKTELLARIRELETSGGGKTGGGSGGGGGSGDAALQDEIDALHMTNADLLRQIQDFGAERHRLDELVKANAMLQQKLDEATKEAQRTAKAAEAAEARRDEGQARESALSEEVADLTRQLAAIKTHRREDEEAMQMQMMELHSELEAAKAGAGNDASAAVADLAALRAEHADHVARTAITEAALEDARAALRDKEAAAATTAAALQQAEAAATATTAQKAEAEARASAAEEAVTAMRDKHEAALAAVRAEAAAATQAHAAAVAAESAASARAATLQNDIETQASKLREAETMAGEHAEVCRKLATAQAAMAEREAMFARTENTMKAALKTAQATAHAAEANHVQLEQRLRQAEQEVWDATVGRQRAEDRLVAVQAGAKQVVDVEADWERRAATAAEAQRAATRRHEVEVADLHAAAAAREDVLARTKVDLAKAREAAAEAEREAVEAREAAAAVNAGRSAADAKCLTLQGHAGAPGARRAVQREAVQMAAEQEALTDRLAAAAAAAVRSDKARERAEANAASAAARAAEAESEAARAVEAAARSAKEERAAKTALASAGEEAVQLRAEVARLRAEAASAASMRATLQSERHTASAAEAAHKTQRAELTAAVSAAEAAVIRAEGAAAAAEAKAEIAVAAAAAAADRQAELEPLLSQREAELRIAHRAQAEAEREAREAVAAASALQGQLDAAQAQTAAVRAKLAAATRPGVDTATEESAAEVESQIQKEAALRTKVADLLRQVENRDRKVAKLTAAAAEAEEVRREAAAAAAATLSEERYRAHQTVADLQQTTKHLQEASEAKARLEHELSVVRAGMRGKLEELDAAQSRAAAESRHREQEAQAHSTQLTQQADAHRAEVARLSEMLAAQQRVAAEHTSVFVINSELEAELAQVKVELSKARTAAVAELQAARASAATEAAAARGEVARLQAALAAAEAKVPPDVQELEQALATLQARVQEAVLERAALENAQKMTQMEFNLAKQEAVHSAETERLAMQTKLHGVEQRAKRLELELAAAESRAEDLSRRMESDQQLQKVVALEKQLAVEKNKHLSLVVGNPLAAAAAAADNISHELAEAPVGPRHAWGPSLAPPPPAAAPPPEDAEWRAARLQALREEMSRLEGPSAAPTGREPSPRRAHGARAVKEPVASPPRAARAGVVVHDSVSLGALADEAASGPDSPQWMPFRRRDDRPPPPPRSPSEQGRPAALARAQQELLLVEGALRYLGSQKHSLKAIQTELEAAKRDWSTQMRALRASQAAAPDNLEVLQRENTLGEVKRQLDEQVGQLNEDVMALRTNKQTILLRQSQLHAFVGRLRDHKGAAGGGELAPESGWLASSLSTKGAPPAAAFHLVLAAIQDAVAQYPRSMASTFLQPTPRTGSSAAAMRQPSSEAGTPHGLGELGKAAGRTPPWSSTPTKLSGKKRKSPKSKQRRV